MRIPFVVLTILGISQCCLAQTTSSQAPATPSGQVTLRAQARLVVLDVIVADKHGTPIHGLQQGDFTVQESGHPQPVKAFEEHLALTDAQSAKFGEMPSLPPGNFTNIVPTPPNAALDIILVDTLNTAAVDQVYVRAQILKYLKTAKPGSQVAVFGLASHLYMLQGFTTDTRLLRAAVDKTAPKPSALLDDSAGLGNSDAAISGQISSNGGGLVSGGYTEALKTFEADDAAFKIQERAQSTLAAMEILGRYLAALPGRKNLIWFSGSFPITVMPSISSDGSVGGIASTTSFSGSASFQKQFELTTNLLARGRVAVYPVDARGVITESFNSASVGTTSARNFTDQVQNLSSSLNDEHATMEQIARDTGGRTFMNTNGLADAVSKVIEQGSSFYTLAYTPTDTRPNGEFRKVDVKLSDEANKKGYTLSYRKGYFADKPASPDSALAPGRGGVDPMRMEHGMLGGALAHGMPNATQFVFKVQILPKSTGTDDKLAKDNLGALPGFASAKPPYRTYNVDYVAPARQATFTTDAKGLHHASLRFVTIVFTPDGKPINLVTSNLEADLNDERLAAFQRTAVAMHQEISVPAKGDFTIRTAILDTPGDRLGSMETPVSLISGLIPAPSASGPASAQPR